MVINTLLDDEIYVLLCFIFTFRFLLEVLHCQIPNAVLVRILLLCVIPRLKQIILVATQLQLTARAVICSTNLRTGQMLAILRVVRCRTLGVVHLDQMPSESVIEILFIEKGIRAKHDLFFLRHINALHELIAGHDIYYGPPELEIVDKHRISSLFPFFI